MPRSQRAPPPAATPSEAAASYARHGLFWVERVLTNAGLSALREAAALRFNEVLCALMVKQVSLEMGGGVARPAKYAEVMCRDGARYDCRHGMNRPPFDSLLKPGGEAGQLIDMLCAVLGEDAEVCQLGQIVALTPDAWAEHGGEDEAECEDAAAAHGDQGWHTDGRNALAPGRRAEADARPHALTLFIPLVDLTLTNGATQYVLGSHRRGVSEREREQRALTLCIPAGSAVAFDFRLWHRGRRNASEADRAMLYAIVGRPIFSDDGAFKALPALDSASESLFDGGKSSGGSKSGGAPKKAGKKGGSGGRRGALMLSDDDEHHIEAAAQKTGFRLRVGGGGGSDGDDGGGTALQQGGKGDGKGSKRKRAAT